MSFRAAPNPIISLMGSGDGYVAKMLPDSGVSWLQFIGGSGVDMVNAVAVDDAGYVYAAGETQSTTDFPIKNALQTMSGGGTDCFMGRLDQDFGTIQTLTFFGVSGTEYALSMALGVDNAVYIGGSVYDGAGPPLFPNSALHENGGGTDAFIAKFTPGLTALEWGGVIGGGDVDTLTGIAVDARSNVYATVNGKSTLTGITPQALLMTKPAGMHSSLAVVNSTGTQFVYLTYLGWSSSDVINALAVVDGVVAIAGASAGTGVPTTSGDPFHVGTQVDGGPAGDAFWMTLTIPAPRLTGVAPDGGPAAMETSVSLSGDFFLPDASVWLGTSNT